jgi:GT2 family glycosyltransferase
LGVYKKSIVDEIGGFREGYEGSQDYDLALRFVEKIKHSEIRHIPRILYHWRMTEGSTAVSAGNKSYAVIASRKAIQEHLDRMNIKAKVVEAPLIPMFNRVIYDIDKNPLVSIIMPTRNGYYILKKCIDSIIEKTSYKNYEIIVVDNNSDDEQTIKYLEYINTLSYIKVVDYNKPFNYSAINNFAVKSAKGDVLVLLNNNTEVINDDWLRELVSHALRPEIGTVGAKLLYPDNTIQHAGVIVGFGGVAGHCHRSIFNEDGGYFGRANLLQNYSAVTGACMAVKKKVYEEAGGMDENLSIAYNDIDFCLKILKLGYYNVYTPYALLYYHKSKTRGYKDAPEKQIRFTEEIKYFNKKWKDIIENDPAYNPNLTLDANYECFSLSSNPRIKFTN